MGNGNGPNTAGVLMEAPRKRKQVIPFGEKILVKRKRVGEKLGKEKLIFASEETASAPTDLATVIYVPDLTFGDQEILNNAEAIILAMTKNAKEGDSSSLDTLLRLNLFIKHKSLKPGDMVMISKYVGTDFTEDDPQEMLTLVNASDIIGTVREV